MPQQLVLQSYTTWIAAFVIPIFSRTDLSGAANNVCIKKIGMVCFERNPIAFPDFSSHATTKRITAVQAINPSTNDTAKFRTFTEKFVIFCIYNDTAEGFSCKSFVISQSMPMLFSFWIWVAVNFFLPLLL